MVQRKEKHGCIPFSDDERQSFQALTVAAINIESMLRVELDSDLKIQFILGSNFAHNFFIELSDYAAEVVGLPKQIFHIEPNFTSSQVLQHIEDIPYNDIQNRGVINQQMEKRIVSEESILNFDALVSRGLCCFYLFCHIR